MCIASECVISALDAVPISRFPDMTAVKHVLELAWA
jgi:hypothetical protein